MQIIPLKEPGKYIVSSQSKKGRWYNCNTKTLSCTCYWVKKYHRDLCNHLKECLKANQLTGSDALLCKPIKTKTTNAEGTLFTHALNTDYPETTKLKLWDKPLWAEWR